MRLPLLPSVLSSALPWLLPALLVPMLMLPLLNVWAPAPARFTMPAGA